MYVEINFDIVRNRVFKAMQYQTRSFKSTAERKEVILLTIQDFIVQLIR